MDDPGSFVVRVASTLRARPRRGARRADPFSPPYEPALHLGPIDPNEGPDGWHVLLNKFPVLPEHYLLVPERFVPQRAPLDRACFEAAHFALAALNGLLFYNAGTVAGASQPHRHLQLVALPLQPGLPPVPLLDAILESRLPVRFACAPTPSEPNAWMRTYRELLARCRWSSERPHNLLATRRWTWLVPRARECWQDVSVNALGFAGSLFVREPAQLERIRRAGPATVLRAVGLPPPMLWCQR